MNSKKLRTIFFVIPSQGRVNFILRTDIFTILKKEGHRLVIFSPFSYNPEFINEFGAENVSFETLTAVRQNAGVRFFLRLRDTVLKNDHPFLNKTILISRGVVERRPLSSPSQKDRALRFIRIILKPIRPILIYISNRLEVFLLYNKEYEKLFKTYKPSSIVIGTMGSDKHDLVFLAHARVTKTPSIVVDLPWSYLDNRAYAAFRPVTKICAWDTPMKNLLERVFNVVPNNIAVTGSARYDHYVHSPKIKSTLRENFFRSHNIDPCNTLITFATGTPEWHPFQTEIAGFICKAIRSGLFGRHVTFFVRLSPGEQIDGEYKILKEHYPEILIEKSDARPHRDFFVNLLAASDVVISHFSSLALDAAILDVPMIYIGFAGKDPKDPRNDYLKRILEFPFVERALATRGVQAAYSLNELVSLLHQYIANPTKDHDGRRRLVQSFLSPFDGKSGMRTANAILEVSKF